MEEAKYSLTLIPTGTGGDIRRLQIPKKYVYWSIIIVYNLVAVLLTMLIHYTYLENRFQASEEIKVSNESLHVELNSLIQGIRKADKELNDSQRFEEKLRNMTNLADESRTLNLAHQNTTQVTSSSQNQSESTMNSEMTVLYNSYSRTPLRTLFQPRIRPVSGWLTSRFGPRADPLTGEASMHLGIDIAAKKGANVIVPAKGQVIFASTLEPFGQMVVIDHGHGISTHYGHLSKILVSPGDFIDERQILGLIGNTGRSVGTHLHYEIRIAGIPVNPESFWKREYLKEKDLKILSENTSQKPPKKVVIPVKAAVALTRIKKQTPKKQATKIEVKAKIEEEHAEAELSAGEQAEQQEADEQKRIKKQLEKKAQSKTVQKKTIEAKATPKKEKKPSVQELEKDKKLEEKTAPRQKVLPAAKPKPSNIPESSGIIPIN